MRAARRKIAIASGTAVLAALALAQRPEFDVASIRVAPPQPTGRTSTRMSVNTTTTEAGRLRYSNVSLKEIVGQAYKVAQYQISGPDPLDSARFDIDAVLPAGASGDQVPLMLQALLADRFRLALHREKKELPVYSLVVGKNGPKIKRAESATGISSDSNRIHWHVTAKTTMPHFAEFLSLRLERPVVDETGLAGAFEITLDWTPDTAAEPGANDTPPGPSIFTAVQEQLGLKLEARKGPVDFLVIDHAENPSGN
jgi:uncharacterized protein (TIGR03435 family)